ncbi:MAG TPA: hypothetical protein VFL03_02140 [Candidatus Limnocylindrales bacterium]|nr:hypothetical protein [Candidatus Limnocylindrales bacterium]
MSRPLRLFAEETPKKVYVSALDWPGLARGAKTEDQAVELLLAALARYAKVARSAGERFDPTDMDLEIVERAEGDAGTAFGIPAIVADADREAVDAREARRLAAIVEASWAELEAVAAAAPEELRKGPRGGGRDRSKVVLHVAEADRGYGQAMGLKGSIDTPEQLADLRATILETLRRSSDGSPIGGKKWPPRYAARRVAWHALDHAWEIEDRTERA